jgi:hypothetical protein
LVYFAFFIFFWLKSWRLKIKSYFCAKLCPKIMKNIRPIYEQLGVDYYYKNYAHAYQNPHEPQVRNLLIQNKDKINYQSCLDFCAGGGEVSQLLLEWDNNIQLIASDPYTQQLYQKNIGRPCMRWSFEDVYKNKIQAQFDSIICSFALHLCPLEKLFPVVNNLLNLAPQLVIISPHKQPDLSNYKQFELVFEDYSLTEKGKKVFLKSYKLAVSG